MSRVLDMIGFRAPVIEAAHPLTLDQLWREAETLGLVRVWTKSDLHDKAVRGYQVKIIGWKRNARIEIEREHTSLHCAFADAINEAREIGLGREG